MNKEIEKALTELGYTQNWLDFGIIDEEYLLNQYNIFKSSDDKNAEHYRSKSFKDFLKSKTSLTNLEINNCINLKDNGKDAYNLHENRVHELIRFSFLTDEQFLRIGELPELQSKSISKIYSRISILRQVDKSGLNLDLLNHVIVLNDSVLEKILLDYDNIPKNCLELLREKGHSKAIRNRANSMLDSNKYNR